jgi:fatty-acyl-CoA synthase
MFHVNAWGLPHAAAMAGSKIVMGANLADPETIVTLAQQEKVTISAGVPTVWLNVFAYLDNNPKQSLSKTLQRVIVGGTAPPRSMIERFYNLGVNFVQIWGMTETSPIGVLNTPLARHQHLSKDEKLDVLIKQGRGMFGLGLKIIDEHGVELPRDGKTVGQLLVRGPWVASGYFKRGPKGLIMDDGWMITGDMATLDEDGYMQIADRAKDMIKSGGEWISSVDLENHAMNHPGVHEAAVIGVHDPKWSERPLLIVVKKDPQLTQESLIKFLETRVAKWWLPEEVLFVPELPHQATGKVSKLTLRKQYEKYQIKSKL